MAVKRLLPPSVLVLVAGMAPVFGANAAPSASVIVAEARQESVEDRVEALGTLRANESVTLTASVTETVTAIHFDDGDRVEAGETLVEMTSAEEHALLEEMRATLDEAQTQYERVKSLTKQGTAARSLLDERRRQWDTARARLSAIESRLDDRLIKAPFAGVVGLRDISPGALVEPGDLITTLDDDRRMKLDFSVPSVHLAHLRPGLPVIAKARAYGGKDFIGEIKSLSSRVDETTRAVMVRAILPNPDRLLKPGMLLRVELQMNPRPALIVPEEALVPQGTRQTVFVVDGDKAVTREISIGSRFPGKVEVTKGLSIGERVVTHGVIKLRPGQDVSIKAVDDGTRPLSAILQSLEEN